MYTKYCVNQPLALSMLSQLEGTDQEFAYYTKNLQDTEPAVRGLSFGSYLIKPVQRLCKYPLLIRCALMVANIVLIDIRRELMQHTNKDESEYGRLSEAAERVSEAVQKVNEVQREADEKAAERIKEIADLAGNIEGAEAIGLMEPDANRTISTPPPFERSR